MPQQMSTLDQQAKEMGTRIRDTRLNKGLTLKELGASVGVSAATVHKWETGKVSNLRTDHFMKLADKLDVEIGYLLGDPAPEEREAAINTVLGETQPETRRGLPARPKTRAIFPDETIWGSRTYERRDPGEAERELFNALQGGQASDQQQSAHIPGSFWRELEGSTPEPELSTEEQVLLETYRKLSRQDQVKVLSQALLLTCPDGSEWR